MARRKAKVRPAQRLTGYGILALLGLITVWLLIQQSRFNPAVLVALRTPQLAGQPQAAAAQAQSALAALIPEVTGFTPLAPTEGYNRDNLSDKIDGKAELYLSAGFKEMSCRMFSLEAGGQTHVDVYLYDMGSPQNAYATSNALFFTQGQYYVEIVADRASETLKTSLEAYATALLAKLPAQRETKSKSEATLFPKEGLVQESVRLNASDAFGLEGFNNVFTGEYSLKSGKATGFIAQRDTPEQAQADARRYLEFLTSNGYKKIQAPGTPADLSVFSLEDSFEIVMVHGRTMAGVHDATSVDAASELADKLRTELKGKQ